MASLSELVLADRHRRLSVVSRFYSAPRQSVERYQVDELNKRWSLATEKIPFYSFWKEEHGLPDQISEIAELDSFPVLDKTHLREHEVLVSQTPGIKRWTLTGGTSGLTTAFPMNRNDAIAAWVNTNLGRRWNGLRTGDKLLLFWGHGHLFSGKWRGLKFVSRKLKDYFLNIRRESAYDLSDANLSRVADSIAAFRPRYIIGYGSCLVALANFLSQKPAYSFRSLKRIVNTSESLLDHEVRLLNHVFGCPVINEYGMAEAGVVGYSVNEFTPIRVFWHDFVLRNNENRIMLSHLGIRCFPLFNYDTGDLTEDDNQDAAGLTEISVVTGKARDVVDLKLKDGSLRQISVVVLDHIIKPVEAISSVHYKKRDDGKLKVLYVSDAPLNHAEVKSMISAGLLAENIDIDDGSIELEELSAPLRTIAGKRQTVVAES